MVGKAIALLIVDNPGAFCCFNILMLVVIGFYSLGLASRMNERDKNGW